MLAPHGMNSMAVWASKEVVGLTPESLISILCTYQTRRVIGPSINIVPGIKSFNVDKDSSCDSIAQA